MADINFTSPEAILMIPIAILLDGTMLIIGFAGDWWGFSDYGTIGWVGWIIIGVWAYFRKKGIGEQLRNEAREEENQQQELQQKKLGKKGEAPATNSKLENLKNPKAAVEQKIKKGAQKLLKKYGFGFIVKGVPIVGDFWPGFTMFVIRELRQ